MKMDRYETGSGEMKIKSLLLKSMRPILGMHFYKVFQTYLKYFFISKAYLFRLTE
jgi:hypothetical protein